jgi:hypothetical protein
LKPLGVDDLLDTLIAELREQGRRLRELNLHVSYLDGRGGMAWSR